MVAMSQKVAWNGILHEVREDPQLEEVVCSLPPNAVTIISGGLFGGTPFSLFHLHHPPFFAMMCDGMNGHLYTGWWQLPREAGG